MPYSVSMPITFGIAMGPPDAFDVMRTNGGRGR